MTVTRVYNPNRIRRAIESGGETVTDAELRNIIVPTLDDAYSQFNPNAAVGNNLGTVPERATSGFFAMIGDLVNEFMNGTLTFERIGALLSGSDPTAARRAAYRDGTQAAHIAYDALAARGGDRWIRIARAATGNGVFSNDSFDAQLMAANGVTNEDVSRGLSLNPGNGDRPSVNGAGNTRYAVADADRSQNYAPSSGGSRSSTSALTANG